MDFELGDRVGEYQVMGILAAGGMGKIYKVKNTISDRIDVIKVVLPNLADDQGLADRFTREIKVLASLNHPNIAGLRTAFRLKNQLLMVMEFVEGTNLEEKAKTGPIPLADSTDYIMQALAALGYAHKQGVIHRDIKPANMMLTPDKVIKLMDFGIAKSKTERKLTQTGTTLGSLFYMSPEQVQGNELDSRSDLYSVGVSLYELVTGSRPFQGKSDFDILIAQLQHIPIPPIERLPDLPRALNDIIMISLEKNPDKRFQTAEAFSAALGSISAELIATPMQADDEGPVANIIQWPQSTTLQASATAMVGTPTVPTEYTSTRQQHRVVATQPQAASAQALPPPVPARGVPAASGSKGYRGLCMTLGALITLAVIVVGATQIPRFLKTSAAGDQTAKLRAPVTPNTGAPSIRTADTSMQPAYSPDDGSVVLKPTRANSATAIRKKPSSTYAKHKEGNKPVHSVASLVIFGGTSGAAVFIDGKRVGTVQLDGTMSVPNIETGLRTIEVRKEMFDSKQLQRNFLAGEIVSLTAIDAALVRTPPSPPELHLPPYAPVGISSTEVLLSQDKVFWFRAEYCNQQGDFWVDRNSVTYRTDKYGTLSLIRRDVLAIVARGASLTVTAKNGRSFRFVIKNKKSGQQISDLKMALKELSYDTTK